jgi:hypothetical protein
MYTPYHIVAVQLAVFNLDLDAEVLIKQTASDTF